jgi:hypothetical protein
MLLASKLNVESSLRVRMLEIREREFQFFMDNVRSVGRLTTVLAGFGHAGLVYTKFIDHNLCGEGELLCAELTYPLATSIALGCAIITMWGSVLLATMAPGAALHSHHDHYSEIVDLVRGGRPGNGAEGRVQGRTVAQAASTVWPRERALSHQRRPVWPLPARPSTQPQPAPPYR